MTTRIYYVPRNQFGRHIMNVIIEKVGCSVGDFKLNRQSDTIRFCVTCNDKDISKVEHILSRYDLISR